VAPRFLRCLALAAALFAPRVSWALDPNRSLAQYARDDWNAKDGLPEGAVLSLKQTADGYLWLGTQSRLVRFDGQSFVAFASNELGLKQYSFVRDLVESQDGALWIGAVGGVARYQRGAFAFFDEQQGLEHPFVYAMAEGPAGSLWIGTGGSGVWRLDDGAFLRQADYNAHPELPSKVNDLEVDAQGNLWVATEGGLCLMASPPRCYKVADGLPSDVVNVVVHSRSGQLWAGTRLGLALRQGDHFQPFAAGNSPAVLEITALLEDSQGNLWVGTRDEQLLRVDPVRMEVTAQEKLASSRGVYAFAEDRDHALWIGMGRGLLRLRDGPFVTLGKAEGLPSDAVLNLARRRAGGLWVLDATGAVSVVEGKQPRMVAPPRTIPGEGMLGMVETSDGTLWIGGAELHRYRQGRWDSLTNPGGSFEVLIEDGSDLLVAQTGADGTSRLAHLSARVFRAIPVSVPLTRVQRLLRARDGSLWISTGGGGLVHVKSESARVFTTRDGLPHDVVYGMAEDTEGRLWVATRAGMAAVRGDRVFNLRAMSDLPKDSPVHVQIDSANDLWITADDGISRISLADLNAAIEHGSHPIRTWRYTTRDGLRSNESSWRASAQVQDADGRLWYATQRGLSVWDPRQVQPGGPSPVAEIEAIRAGQKSLALRSDLRLREGRERLEFRFTAPRLASPDQVEFRYRLRGYDKDWVPARSNRAAVYTNVPAGDYTFEVAARFRQGQYDSPSATLRLWVAPYWYETWWARISFGALVLLAILGVFRLRLRSLRAQRKALLQMVGERTEDLRREVDERRAAEQQVRRLNDDLELRVMERTQELIATNAELASDIQKRHRVEAALAAETERLAVILRSVAEAVVTTDLEGRVATTNPAAERMTGWSPQESRGRPFAEVVHLIDPISREPAAGNIADKLQDAGEQMPLGTDRHMVVHRDGSELLVDISAAPLRDPGGVLGYVFVLHDVTRRARAEELVQRTQRLESLGSLAAGIAHDFNNFLTGIGGYVDLTRAVLPPSSRGLAWLSEAMDVLDDARGLSRRLLTFSAGGNPIVEPRSLDELVRRCTRFALAQSNVVARYEIADDLDLCEIDPLQMRQAIDNLVVNARQAMPQGGNLVVEARNIALPDLDDATAPPKKWVELVFRDDGPGIPPAIRNRIFDPFFTTKSTGTGLGLATVHSIITQHRGTIEVDSTVGKGTAFRIRLPAANAAPASVEPVKEMPSPPIADGSAPTRILVMDDNQQIRALIKRVLHREEIEVVLSEDGEEAVDMFREDSAKGRPFGLVILDLTVANGMGGLAALRAMHEIDPGIRAIAMSGYAKDPVQLDPRSHGFFSFLAKPFNLDELKAAVQAAIGNG
jgi:PAS domain S-box-containing protein